MAFPFNGTATVNGGTVTIFPDGTSSSVTFDVTKQPFNLPFISGNCPSSVIGPSSYSVQLNPPNGVSYKYDTVYSYDPITFQITITFTKDPGAGYVNEPALIPTILTPTVGFTFQYISL